MNLTRDDYTNIFLGNKKLVLIGDLGTFFYLPNLSECTDRERMYYYCQILVNPEASHQYFHNAGWMACSLIRNGFAKAEIIDYARDIQEFLRLSVAKATNMDSKKVPLFYHEIDPVNRNVMEAMKNEVSRQAGLLEEEHIFVDTTDRNWREHLFPGMKKMNTEIQRAAKKYMTMEEIERMESQRQMGGLLNG